MRESMRENANVSERVRTSVHSCEHGVDTSAVGARRGALAPRNGIVYSARPVALIRACSILCALACAACGAKTGLFVPPCECDAGPVCEPREETCNGLDDDCDDAIDDGLACFTLDGVRIDPITSSLCGAAWYSYGSPDAQSANPTPDIRRSGGVVVAVQWSDGCPGASLAVIADLPDDESGGQLVGDFEIDPPSAAGILVSDEPSECTHAAGTGRCTWVWQACCTDGVLLGAIAVDACVSLTLSSPMGISELAVLDGPSREIDRAFGEPMEICATIRPAVP
jgi:hypothetical protein